MSAFTDQPHTNVRNILPSEVMVSMWMPAAATFISENAEHHLLNTKIYEDYNPLSYVLFYYKTALL